MTFDPKEAERLVREAIEDDERMTPGPWRHANGKGAAQVISDDADTRCAIFVNVNRDGGYHPDTVKRWQGDSKAIARTRNNLRPLAEQLRAALAELEESRREADYLRRQVTELTVQLAALTRPR